MYSFIFQLNSVLRVTSKQPGELCSIRYLESDGKQMELDESVLNQRHCHCSYSVICMCRMPFAVSLCKTSFCTPVQMVPL